jgi:hypothetical protein
MQYLPLPLPCEHYKCLSFAFKLNKVDEICKANIPLPLSKLEFLKIIYLYLVDLMKLIYLPNTGIYPPNFQSSHVKAFHL